MIFSNVGKAGEADIELYSGRKISTIPTSSIISTEFGRIYRNSEKFDKKLGYLPLVALVVCKHATLTAFFLLLTLQVLALAFQTPFYAI